MAKHKSHAVTYISGSAIVHCICGWNSKKVGANTDEIEAAYFDHVIESQEKSERD